MEQKNIVADQLDANYYQKGFNQALKTFRETARSVPAYKDFLQKRGINSSKINTRADFLLVPPVTKENYLKQYPLRDLLINGDTGDARVISMSSGSSGQPFFWFRGNRSVTESSRILFQTYQYSFRADQTSTLCIIAFAMGTWIAGTYILAANNHLADRNFQIVSITPGMNTREIIKIIDTIGAQFAQIVIAGYPPFIRDVVDEASGAGVRLKNYKIKFLFAGENFSEVFRDYLLKGVNSTDPCFDTASIYGTADAGIVGIENPFSIFLRRYLYHSRQLLPSVFPGTELLPSLVTYNPVYRYCEEIDNQIIFTANNSLPLVRYNILDEGIIVDGADLYRRCIEMGMSMPAQVLSRSTRHLIAIYGRQDVATMFYSLNLYPENIKKGLEVPRISKFITGKFVVRSENRRDQSQKLLLSIELRPGVEAEKSLRKEIEKSVVAGLEETNSEYRKLRSEIKQKSNPIISLLPFASAEFKIKTKHKWVAKE